LWRRALLQSITPEHAVAGSAVKRWEELIPTSDTWAQDPGLRLVVLPWSNDALDSTTWKAVLGIRKQNPRILISRVPITDGELARAQDDQPSPAYAYVDRIGLLSILTTRQPQHAALHKYAQQHGCSLSSIGIQPLTFTLTSDPERCAKLGTQGQSNRRTQEAAWFVKHRSHIQVLPSVDELKAELGPCESPAIRRHGQQEPVFQQALVAPLLVHGRRIKLHAFMLIASTAPLTAFVFHHGLVTLASARARTVATGLK
jgi:hypothetical protein